MEAFYLKYRPQTLDDLIGQESVKKIIKSAHLAKKLAHAYLLVGPRGTGKTSLARILAKMVNCESSESIPCNKCNTCISITDGSNLDLIEIDAASNRGIDDIRNLREKIKLSPTSAKKKVYIIDEVHMLTPEAFNALLKTLEEPPAHALFILATTEVAKIPQTILSRVQRLDFKLAKVGELLQVLKKIVTEEKIKIEDDALQFLTKTADGSFRDAVKLLDQIASIGGKITTESLLENLKYLRFEELVLLLEALADKNTPSSLMAVQKSIEEGIEVKELNLSLMEMLRNLLLIKNGLGENLVKPHFTDDKYERLVALSEKFKTSDLTHNLNVFQEAFEKLKFAGVPSLPLEVAVIEICGEDQKIQMESGKIESDSVATEGQTSLDSDTSIPSDSSDLQKLKEKWTFVLETIRPYNFSLEALLRSIQIHDCTHNNVILEVPYSFHQRILEAPKNRDLLEGILSDVLGRSIQISTILGGRPERREDIANIEVAADDEIIKIATEIFNS